MGEFSDVSVTVDLQANSELLTAPEANAPEASPLEGNPFPMTHQIYVHSA